MITRLVLKRKGGRMKRYQHISARDDGGHTYRAAIVQMRELAPTTKEARSQGSSQDIVDLLTTVGRPIVISGRWRFNETTTLDGYLRRGGERKSWTLLALYFDSAGKRIRCMGGRGPAWGQSGRCWIDLDTLGCLGNTIKITQ